MPDRLITFADGFNAEQVNRELDNVVTLINDVVPSKTTTQRDAIVSPATGRLIFNSTTGRYEFYTGAAWAAVGGTVTVQSGTSTIASGTASTTATITAVVLAKTYLVFSLHTHGVILDIAVRGRITSTTQLTFDTGVNTSGDVDISWFVVESS